MVTKYIILANSNDERCGIPRQLLKFNGETICGRTVRLLKENGIEDITVTAKDKRFDKLGAKRYEPINNTFDYKTSTGYFIDCFPLELMTEPVCFLMGDVYFSEEAIKTIVNSDTDSVLFFCSYENKNPKYMKKWDEPFGFKVVDTELFKEHITRVKKLYDEKATWRNPIAWELYRSINGQNVNEHRMTKNYIAINDITCDIDYAEEIDLLKLRTREDYTKKLSIIIPYYQTYELTEKLLDKLIPQLNKEVEVFLVDDGCNETRLDKYSDVINIIHLKENGGDSVARNVAIKQANGKYIGFIDSDDLIIDDYIEELLKNIDEHNEDVIFFDWQDMNTGFVVRHPTNYAVWKAIYKTNIIPLFVEGRRYSSDVPFQEDLNSKDYTRFYIDRVLYYYNSNREGSLSQEKAKIVKEENSK